MYSMVLMAALTTGIDMPDRGRGCHGGCWGGCYGGWGGGGWGGCHGMGMGWGGCYGGGYGMGMGYGGCYGGGMGMGYGGMGMGMGYGGCYGGGYSMGMGMGYGGYAMGGYSPVISGYAYSPVISRAGIGTPIVSTAGTIPNTGTTQSFYNNPANNSGNQATLIVHLPQSASLKIDGQATQQSSGTRTFTSPPLEQGKTYVYNVAAEVNRNGHTVRDSKNIEVRAGQRSEVTLSFGNSNGASEEASEPISDEAPRRNNLPRSSPRLPPEDR